MDSAFCLILFVGFFPATITADLYNSSDPLVLLNVKNLYDTILGSNLAWIVEFYNSWCGHCINYAPKWREFSNLIKDWDHTIKAGVVDCSDKENVPLCRDYEVMAYPTIKIFGSNAKKGHLGTNLQKLEVKNLQESILDFVLDQENRNLGSSSWMNLQSYNGSIKDIFMHAPSAAKYAVLVAEEVKSSVGRHTIMDLGNFPVAYIRTVDAKNKELAQLKITSFPSVVIVARGGKKEILSEKFSTREELTALIMDHLKLTKDKGPIDNKNLRENENGSKEKMLNDIPAEGAGDGQPEEINGERLSYDDALPDTAYTPQIMRVFMVDMENAISYALGHEVLFHKTLTGDTLNALKNFLHVLVKYFPARPQMSDYLRQLKQFVDNSGDTLEEAAYEKALKYLTTASSFLPDHQQWKGCQGSQAMYRGYPCGLWTLFHTITVNAFVAYGDDSSYDPREALRGIHGYVKHFFSCDHCSKHFQEMYSLDAESSVRVAGDEVLWLWRGHNKVNKRLKGDRSEDPEHPKRQVPTKEQCPSCRKEGDYFNSAEVLSFLKRTYGREYLSMSGVQKQLPFEDSRSRGKQSKVFDVQRQNFLTNDVSVDRRNKNVNVGRQIEINKLNSWGFTNTDINLCVMLYLFSTLIIVAGYFMFMLKRRLRRKKFIELHKVP